jgi:hypothetical protein
MVAWSSRTAPRANAAFETINSKPPFAGVPYGERPEQPLFLLEVAVHGFFWTLAKSRRRSPCCRLKSLGAVMVDDDVT